MLNFLLVSSFSIFIFNFVFELTFSISEIEHDDASWVGEGNSMEKKKWPGKIGDVQSARKQKWVEIRLFKNNSLSTYYVVGKNMEQRLQL